MYTNKSKGKLQEHRNIWPAGSDISHGLSNSVEGSREEVVMKQVEDAHKREEGIQKELEDAQQALVEAQTAAQLVKAEVKELRIVLSDDRHSYALLENIFKDKTGAQAAEIQSLRTSITELHEQHKAELDAVYMQITAMRSQVREGQAEIIQRLQQERQQLREVTFKLQAVLNSVVGMDSLQQQLQDTQDALGKAKLELNQADNAKKILEKQILYYGDQLEEIEKAQMVTEKKFVEVNEELHHVQSSRAKLIVELETIQGELGHAQHEAANMCNQMHYMKNSHAQENKTLTNLDIKLCTKAVQHRECFMKVSEVRLLNATMTVSSTKLDRVDSETTSQPSRSQRNSQNSGEHNQSPGRPLVPLNN
jgi:chromosome segregation ATPase